MIIHTEEVQAVGRRRRAGLRARPALEQRRHGFGLAPPASDVDQRSTSRWKLFIYYPADELELVIVRVVPFVWLPVL